VVVSAVGGLDEIARRSRGTVATVPPRKPAKLATLLEKLLRNPREARELGEKVRSHVQKAYSWKKTAEHVLSALEEMGKRRKRNERPVAVDRRRKMRMSVLTCCYRYRKRFTAFLQALTQQTLPRAEFELVVTNPQSPDGLGKYLAEFKKQNKSFNLTVVDAPEIHRGNRGWMIDHAFKHSRGGALMIADCDCILPPHFLEKALGILEVNPDRILGVYRNLLSTETTERILSGELDPVAGFQELRKEDQEEKMGYRGVLGYCQIVRREVYLKTPYRDDIESIAKSDVKFLEDLAEQQGVTPLRIEGETLLHLWHPRDWSGTKGFL
jgi:hypothetical protein